MKTLVVSTAIIALLLPTTVLAEDLSFGGGVTVTSNSLSDGLSETGNSPAIQPYFELAKNGFYAGVWATNLKDDVGNRAELDLSLGYRGETAAGIGYDLGYTQHFYDKTHAASSELAVSLGCNVGDLGSRLINFHSQKMTMAARAMAERKTMGQRSYRVATRRQSLSLPNMISILLRRL